MDPGIDFYSVKCSAFGPLKLFLNLVACMLRAKINLKLLSNGNGLTSSSKIVTNALGWTFAKRSNSMKTGWGYSSRVSCRMEINSKAFAIPFLTASSTTSYFVHEMAMKKGILHESAHEISFMHNYVCMKYVWKRSKVDVWM